MKNQRTRRGDIAIRMFVSIVKTLDDESVRYIGTFKREQKKAFTNLLTAISSFQSTVKANMDEANINECERIQDYLHNMVEGLISEGKKDIDLFCAMCLNLTYIYKTYIGEYFKHSDKEKFITLMNHGYFFSDLFVVNQSDIEDFKYFCVTLIEGKTYERTI